MMKAIAVAVGLTVMACLSPGCQVFDTNNPPEGTIKIIGGNLEGNTGCVVRNIGDFNGDGLPELAIAAPMADTVYVILGKHKFPATINLSNLGPSGFIIMGPEGSGFGFSVAGCKDINRDGRADVAIGAPYEDEGGRVYVIAGTANLLGSMDVADESVSLLIVEGGPGEQLGLMAGGGEKFDNDASSDLFIPSPFFFSVDRGLMGAGYIIYGQREFPEKIVNTQTLDPSSTLTIVNDRNMFESNISNFGLHFKAAGDITQNGFSDAVLYGGVDSSEPGSSSLYIIPGGERLTGTLTTGELPEETKKVTFQLFPIADMHEINSIVGCDLNQDGKIELAVGTINAGMNEDVFTGAVGVIFISDITENDIVIDQFQESGKNIFLFSPEARSLYGFDLTQSDTTLFACAPNMSNSVQTSIKNQGGVLTIGSQALGLTSGTSAASPMFFGKNEADSFGVSIDFLGDLDRDGADEIVVGVHEKAENTANPAVAYILPVRSGSTSVGDYMLY